MFEGNTFGRIISKRSNIYFLMMALMWHEYTKNDIYIVEHF